MRIMSVQEEINRQNKNIASIRKSGTSANDGAVIGTFIRRYTDDGYIFNASDIIEILVMLISFPHGDHYHYIQERVISQLLQHASPSYLVEVANQRRLLIAVPITTVLAAM